MAVIRPSWTRRAARALVLVTAVALGTTVVDTAAAVAADDGSQYGTLTEPDAYLPGANTCGSYRFSYDLAPPPGIWGAEFFVVDPRGNTVASYTALDNYSAGGVHGASTYTLCRNNTAPGVFTIRGKISTDDGRGNVTTYQMKSGTFTLVDQPPAAKPPKAVKKKKSTKKGKKNRKGKKRRS